MITFKFVIDITRSNSNNLPAVYLFLSKLFSWLEKEASPEICAMEKNYMGIYFGDYDSENGSYVTLFDKGEDFLKNFAEQKIRNGREDGKDDGEDVLNMSIHAGITPQKDKSVNDIMFLFTDQALEKECEFAPADHRQLKGVFLFADFKVNAKEKDFMNMSFPIQTEERSMEPAIQYDWEILKDKGIPECILFPLEKYIKISSGK